VRPEKDFDVIVIGAGPAGSACAYTLAQAGKSVLLVERGDYPGAKNVTGGRIYSYALEQLNPDFYREAELERKVVHEQIALLDGDQSIIIDYHNPLFSPDGERPQSYTVLRSKFDRWLADKAEEIGATLICGIRVDELIEDNGRVIGIIAGEDNMYCDAVVAADGVNSLMAQKAGLIGDIQAHSVGVGVKEIIELAPEIINERFNVQTDEGAARMILGCTEGIHGGAFLYTNKNSISLGAVYSPQEVAQKGKSVHRLFQEIKLHPAIYPLLKNGKTVEYAAHLVSENGYRGIAKKLHKEGLLLVGDAAGFVINLGYTIRGIDLAILSGISAAKAIISSEDPAKIGPAYEQELAKVLLPTMKAVDGYYDIMQIKGLYKNYPGLANSLMQKLFTVNGEIALSLKKQIKPLLQENNISLWQMVKDVLKVVKLV
jgi:electron transfer flavoprotein-quinone oxidoreductase